MEDDKRKETKHRLLGFDSKSKPNKDKYIDSEQHEIEGEKPSYVK